MIAAPVERVFAALVDPEALTVWLPPEGMSGRFEWFDARPGGSYRLVLTYADAAAAPGKTTADSDVVQARFVDVVPGVRVVQAVDFVSDDPAQAGTMTMTWAVSAVDGGTRVEFRAEDVPAGISAADHAEGMSSSLANLARHVEAGRIILLNGASSAGKSSIGRALLGLLPDPWFFVPVDAFGEMRSTVHTRVLDEAEIAAMLRRTRLGYHRAVAGLVSAGNDVIMDYPLSEQWRLDDLLHTLRGYDVTLVEVRCSMAELERREKARGDREPGTARWETLVYQHGDCDIAVDTTSTGAYECAVTIVREFGELTGPKAFDRLRGARR